MEEQLEALKINDSFESDQESPRAKIIRTFSFPSSQLQFCETSEELKSPKLDRHYSEQILYPNTRSPLSEVQTHIKRARYIFYDNSKVPEHSRKNKVPSAFTPVDQVEYMEIEKYPDSTKHDTTPSTTAPILAVDQAEVMEIEKFMKPMDPVRCMDLSKLISTEPLAFATVIEQAHTNMLKSVFNLESKFSETNEDITKLIPTRRKFRKTCEIQEDNSDHTNNEDDKKQKNYQDTKEEKIRLKNASKYSKVKQALCACLLICLIAISIFVFLLSVPLYEDQDKHSNTFATAVVELKKEIFGQDQAVEILTKYLQQDSPFLKIIALVGGTGVGKSYTVEIIRKNFYEKNSNHFFSLRKDLLVLENLREEDSLDIIKFVKMHQKTYDNRYGTILVVFNVEQMNDDSTRSIDLNKSVNVMKNTFVDANLDIKIIPYESLSEDALEKCIIKIAKNIDITLSQDQIAIIKRQLIENNTGCKGAYSKIQVIGRQ